MLHAVLVINKSGGLIYNRDFGNGIAKLSSNEYLVLAGTFHGVHAITCQISPVAGSQGIELLESQNLNIYCYQSPTGLKFVIITKSRFQNHELVCKRLYDIYSDYAMKNPFYTPEMPIRAELFDANVAKLVKQINQ
ncbi:Sybindin-like protein [Gorgonomyces haynaldii]|nr:Sybindin-like protein [Gorgonomyces haynaldii]